LLIGVEKSGRHAREVVTSRLRARRREIEEAMLCRVRGIADPSGEDENQYEDRIRQAVAEAFEHALEVLESDRASDPTPPTSLLWQARLAARSEIPLDLILRRYFAAFALFSHFVLEEVEKVSEEGSPSGEGDAQELFQVQAREFDRLVEFVAAEYRSEIDRRRSSPCGGRADEIKRLLAGEPPSTASLDYDLGVWHLGLILGGDLPDGALKSISKSLDRRLLRAQPEGGLTWAWLGGRRPTDASALLELCRTELPDTIRVAVGEPALGLSGWRLSHWQAAAAFRHADGERWRLVRYAEVGLAVCVQKDHVLAATLHQLFLDPLKGERDGGETLRQTLRAYLSSGRNVSSAAASLGVSRQTVASRIRAYEERIGKSVSTCEAEMDIALRLPDVPAPTP
jgi:hypothetical protein